MNYSQVNGMPNGLSGLPEFLELSKSDSTTTSEMQQGLNVSASTAAAVNDGKQQFMPPHVRQQQNVAMAEYLQKLHATSLPLTLQQIMKLQSESHSGKREKPEDESEDTNEQSQANKILNIPTVPGFRNSQNTQNGNNNAYMNPESIMMEINPHDLNVHMEDNSSPEVGLNSGQNSEKQTRVDGCSTKTSEQQTNSGESICSKNGDNNRTRKFRAKTGEIKIAMGLDGSMLYCCPECSLAFSDKSDIENHIQGHVQERKYQCKECGAMLKRKEHLDQHMRGHSNKRPYKCPVCHKAFKRNEHLTRHYVIHSGDKNFTCTICTKAFSRKDHLNKHASTHLGMKRTKTGKKESSPIMMMDNNVGKDLTDDMMTSNNEAALNTKSEGISFLQHIHHLQKDQNFIQTFSAFKEQALRDSCVVSAVSGGNGSGAIAQQQQAVNMSEILPQNSRYLMPSQLPS